jgi:hypothetical protein
MTSSKLKFTIDVNVPKEKLWETLWNDATYREWTAAFTEGSYAESDWNEGSKVLFLSPDGNGMFGIIDKKIPYRQMTFKHLGEIKNGVEEPKDWGGALESYHLEDIAGGTRLDVELDATGEFETYLKNAFPKALEKLRQVAER